MVILTIIVKIIEKIINESPKKNYQNDNNNER